MRLSLDARAQRLLRRLPRTTVYSALEIVLLFVLAVQCARLVWAVVTPVGPLGDWRSDAGAPALATPEVALFEAFDPFFRLEGDAPIVVTDLDLKLYGVREDRASGRGSAIIALPSGEQNSYVVGEEIMPGVVLESVGFDFVTIARNGGSEQLFLDQSTAPGSSGSPSPGAAPAAPSPARATGGGGGGSGEAGAPALTPQQLARGTQVSPRREGNRLTGIVLQPTDDGSALRAAGFQPGDVLLSINGQRIQDMGQAAQFATDLGSGDALVQVERGGETISFRARVGQ